MLDMTGKSLFSTGNKKIFEIFFENFFENFFFEKKLRKRHIVPKNEKGDPLGFINILSVAKYQKKSEGGTLLKKKFAQCRKKN